MIEAARTLMKSEPELAELVASVEGVEVTMAEKGFGTRVELRAGEGSGLGEADLERSSIASPSRRSSRSADPLSPPADAAAGWPRASRRAPAARQRPWAFPASPSMRSPRRA